MDKKKNEGMILFVLLTSFILLFNICLKFPILFVATFGLVSFFIYRPKQAILSLIPLTAIIVALSSGESYNFPEITFILIAVSFVWALKKIINNDYGVKNANLFYLVFGLSIFSFIVGISRGSFQISNLSIILFVNSLDPMFGLRLIVDFLFSALLIIIVSNEFKKEDLKLFEIPILLAGGIILLFSIFHFISFNPVTRFTGFLSNSNKYSIVILIFLPIFLSMALFSEGYKKWTSAILAFLFLIFISFTLSRNSIAISFFILIIFFLKKVRKFNKIGFYKKAFALLGIFVVLIVILLQIIPTGEIYTRLTDSYYYYTFSDPQSRTGMATYVISEIKISPLFGEGPGSFRLYQNYLWKYLEEANETSGYFYSSSPILHRNTHMHSIIFDTLLNVGLIGALILFLIFFIVMKKAWKNKKTPLEEGIFYSLVAVLLNSILDMPLYGIEIATLFYIFSGMAIIEK